MKRYVLPKELYLWILSYLLLTIVLHWRLMPDIGIFIYGIGALVGAHLLPFIEATVNMTPSPLRNLVSYIILTILTFFVLTSSALPLGKGVVLFLNLHFMHLMYTEYKSGQRLGTWLQGVPDQNHRTYLWVFWGIFIVESLLFILI